MYLRALGLEKLKKACPEVKSLYPELKSSSASQIVPLCLTQRQKIIDQQTGGLLGSILRTDSCGGIEGSRTGQKEKFGRRHLELWQTWRGSVKLDGYRGRGAKALPSLH